MPNQRPAPVDDKVARGPHSPSAQAEKPLEEQGVQELAMAVFAEVLQQPVTSAAQHFFDLGGCSITALDVLQKMEDATGVRISLRSFLHEPTPIHLAQCIQESRSGQTMNATASSDSLRLVVQQAFEKVLQIQTPAPSANFFDLGGCSLTALDVLEHVERATSRRVGLRQFLHEPTIEALAFSLAQLGNEQELSPQPETRYSSMQHLAAADKTTEFRLSEDASGPGFSVFFFSGKAPPHAQPGIYQLLLDAARMADERGFEAIWVPERHFHSFGGLFPAPSVLAGAIAACTRRISIRAGSVVLPLHNPVSVVEEWSVVDNLSGGRVGMALAPGFHPTDFALQPDRFADRRAFYNTAVKQLKQLWRGEPYHGPDGLGREVDLVPLPRPLQRELPVWITVADSEQNFREAGEAGSNVLTALLSLDVKTLAERIAVYRQALAGRPGKVTLMLHTFVHPDADTVASVGVDALRRYLDHHLDFASQRINYEKVNKLAPSDREALVNHAVSRYLNDGSLIGTPQQCAKFVKRLIDIGVQEFACLVDFGVSTQAALDSLNEVAGLKAALAAGALA